MSGCLLVRIAFCSPTHDEGKKVEREREREKERTGRRKKLRGKMRKKELKRTRQARESDEIKEGNRQ